MTLQDKIDECLRVMGQSFRARRCVYDTINESYTFYITSMSEGDYETTTYSIKRKDLIEKIENRSKIK